MQVEPIKTASQTKDETVTQLKRKADQLDMADRLKAKIDGVRLQAEAATKRLLAKRPPFGRVPKDMEDFMDLVDRLTRDASKNGVFLSKRDRRCLQAWHQIKRAELKAAAEKEKTNSGALGASGAVNAVSQDVGGSIPSPETTP